MHKEEIEKRKVAAKEKLDSAMADAEVIYFLCDNEIQLDKAKIAIDGIKSAMESLK